MQTFATRTIWSGMGWWYKAGADFSWCFLPHSMFFRSEIRLWRTPRQLEGEVIRGQATAWEHVCGKLIGGHDTRESRPNYLALSDGILGHSLLASAPPRRLPLSHCLPGEPVGVSQRPGSGSLRLPKGWLESPQTPTISHLLPTKHSVFLCLNHSLSMLAGSLCSTSGFGNESKRCLREEKSPSRYHSIRIVFFMCTTSSQHTHVFDAL